MNLEKSLYECKIISSALFYSREDHLNMSKFRIISVSIFLILVLKSAAAASYAEAHSNDVVLNSKSQKLTFSSYCSDNDNFQYDKVGSSYVKRTYLSGFMVNPVILKGKLSLLDKDKQSIKCNKYACGPAFVLPCRQRFPKDTSYWTPSKFLVNQINLEVYPLLNVDQVIGSLLNWPSQDLKKKNNRARGRSGYFVEVEGILGRHKKNFSEQTDNTKLRNETENEWYLWGLNLGAGLHFGDRFYGVAQLNWIQQKDRFSLRRENVNRLVVEEGTDGSKVVTTATGTWVSEGEIRYNTLNAAALVGYNFLDSKKVELFNIGIEAGVMHNMRLSTSGKVAINEYNVSRVENEDIYKTNLGFGVVTQIVTQFYLNKNLSVTVKPYFSTYLNSWSKDSYSAKMRINSFGTFLGVRREF